MNAFAPGGAYLSIVRPSTYTPVCQISGNRRFWQEGKRRQCLACELLFRESDRHSLWMRIGYQTSIENGHHTFSEQASYQWPLIPRCSTVLSSWKTEMIVCANIKIAYILVHIGKKKFLTSFLWSLTSIILHSVRYASQREHISSPRLRERGTKFFQEL